VLLIAAVPAILATPQPVVAQPAAGEPGVRADRSAVTVEVLAAGGTDCPTPDQFTATLSPDNGYLHLTYEKFQAEVGDGAPPADGRANCRMNLVLRHPADVTYAVVQADYLGTVRLAAGATGSVRGSWIWADTTTAPSSTSMSGPLDDELRVTHGSDIGPFWEGCGRSRPLRLATELTIVPGTSDPAQRSVLALAAGPDDTSSSYTVVWAPCDGVGPAR
jgi:hypothetical protein